ncbi:hypothetical protein GIB67_016155 [Kingdonia uniflora]|uniref:Prephenate dehydratase domain-containing protein n=1 Tax=Kingdonia uniflora TaxID=39325 RepID=A0A7J7N9G6_9MAGN|nr:hypothetical protein GIB67_016155 [Kingdonia uniflora]
MDQRISTKKMTPQKFIVLDEARKLALMTMGKDWHEQKVQKRKVIDIEVDLEQALTNCLEDQENHIPSHPIKYKLFWLTLSNVVAIGHWYNEEPTCKVHNVPLGIGMLKVQFFNSANGALFMVIHCRSQAWIKEEGKGPDSTGLTTSPDNYGCILADDMGHSRKEDVFSCKTAGIHLTSKPSSGDSLNLKRVKWEGLSSQRAIILVKDENPSLEFKQILVPIEEVDSKKYNRDLSFLPKPLSIANFSASNSNGTNVRVAYQGVPGTYSKAAALKAYPECEAVPCDRFEATFKVVELWLVDKVVLPIENTGCKKGWPEVCLSHPQALAQCEMYLTKLGVVRESTDDTAGAAQFVALNHLKDTKVVARARATDIYGLKVLVEKIQDDFKNITHFLILVREPIISKDDRPFKTSIFFTLEEGPEVLFKALVVFAMH